MAKLDHPHIVGVHDFFFVDGVSCLVMSYIAGGSLAALLKRRCRLPLAEALHISRGILYALNFAHSKGVIHRDVKPSNILVRPDGHAYLVDFGIALVAGTERRTALGTNIGTPKYMSPEQIQAREIDHLTDVYFWLCEDSILLYFEAITQIRKRGLQPVTPQEIVYKTLQDSLRGIDPFSDYLSPTEYLQFKKAQQQHYAGVGVELHRDANGRIVCTPYAQGPAIRAGITAGDILEAVDGHAVTGRSLLAVSAQMRGEKCTRVRLTITTATGESRDIVIARADIQVQSVRVEQHEPLPLIRLLTFARDTAPALQEPLRHFAEAPALILDLRGNPGGALSSAIDAAKLFVPPGQTIMSIHTQADLEVYRQELATPPLTVPLYVWQDADTASAAEVFIAALVQNKRAVSIGKKTFGKGTVQEVIELTDGSALYLTIGMLQTSDGTLYHNKGLEPTYPLATSTARSEDYLAKVTALRLQAPADTLARKMAIPDRQAASEKQPALRRYVLCFDRDFVTKQDAEIWFSEVRLSLREDIDHYQLKRKKSDGIYYMVCIGVYNSKDMADKKRQEISHAVQDKVFIEVLE